MAQKRDDGMTPLDQAIGQQAPTADPSDPGPQDPKAPPTEPTVLGPESASNSREDFSGAERIEVVETASVALAAQAKAEVEARYIMAVKRPRDLDVFRERLLKDCKRASFAEMAEYSKPIGGKSVNGASIRFIEVALRHYGNVIAGSAAIYDDAAKRIVRVTVTDLETNFTVPMDVTIEKTVERSSPRQGATGPEFLSARKNSNGRMVYLVEATEDDMLTKERALISKAMRTNGERLLPPDIKEEALALCRRTLKDRATKDPDAERRAIADAFNTLNVSVGDLKAFLGHDLAQSTPAELVGLRAVFTALREGSTTWPELMAAKSAKAQESGNDAPASKASEILGRMKPGAAQPAPPVSS